MGRKIDQPLEQEGAVSPKDGATDKLPPELQKMVDGWRAETKIMLADIHQGEVERCRKILKLDQGSRAQLRLSDEEILRMAHESEGEEEGSPTGGDFPPDDADCI